MRCKEVCPLRRIRRKPEPVRMVLWLVRVGWVPCCCRPHDIRCHGNETSDRSYDPDSVWKASNRSEREPPPCSRFPKGILLQKTERAGGYSLRLSLSKKSARGGLFRQMPWLRPGAQPPRPAAGGSACPCAAAARFRTPAVTRGRIRFTPGSAPARTPPGKRAPGGRPASAARPCRACP